MSVSLTDYQIRRIKREVSARLQIRAWRLRKKGYRLIDGEWVIPKKEAEETDEDLAQSEE